MNRIYPVSNLPMKDTVAIIGFARSSRDQIPWDRTDIDLWGLNEEYNHFFPEDKASAWFQMHPYWNFTRENNQNDPEHRSWMRKPHAFPIYTQKVFPDVPSSVEFPLIEVTNLVGREYFTSSFAFMLGLAMYYQFKRIEIYGFEMMNNTEYGLQRPNAEWLLGLAEGKGYEIYLPNGCNLLNGRLYGYRSVMTGYRQALEFRQAGIEDKLNKAIADFNYQRGRMQAVKEYEVGELALKAEVEKAKESQALVNTIIGAKQELSAIIDTYDNYSMGEEEDHA